MKLQVLLIKNTEIIIIIYEQSSLLLVQSMSRVSGVGKYLSFVPGGGVGNGTSYKIANLWGGGGGGVAKERNLNELAQNKSYLKLSNVSRNSLFVQKDHKILISLHFTNQLFSSTVIWNYLLEDFTRLKVQINE